VGFAKGIRFSDNPLTSQWVIFARLGVRINIRQNIHPDASTMILNRENFYLRNKCVIEKIIIKPPHRLSTLFEDKACFLHFKNTDTVIYSATEKLILPENDCVMLKCGNVFVDFTGSQSCERCEVYAVHLYPDILKEIYEADFPSFIKPRSGNRDVGEIRGAQFFINFIEGLALYFEHPQAMNHDLLVLKMKEIVLLLFQSCHSKTISAMFSDIYSPRIVTISQILESHLYSDLSVNELADLAGLSLSTFKREFKKQFQDTPSNYIRDKRLEKTKELLLKTKLPISEICYQGGFKDIAHFSRLFKQKFKTSPSGFRRVN
jgi:AraC-like DNA-binding protein